MRCSNCHEFIQRCGCGGTACPGYCHVDIRRIGKHGSHYCGPDPEKKASP